MSGTAGGPGPRLERVRAELERLGAATLLVSNPVNVAYLTGFASSNAALLVGRNRVLLVTDGRYVEAAREVAGVEVVQAERELPSFLSGELAELAEAPVAFEAAHVTYAAWASIAESGVELHPSTGAVEELRSVKDEAELHAIRRAARVADAAYRRLAGEDVVGRSEADVAWWLEQALHEAGAEDLAFPTIVASGPHAALPHHHPGERPVQAGETVVVDLGAKVEGYCSDCTRTFATGPLPAELEGAYDVCREAQEQALAAVRPGASAREVDAIARERIVAAGYEPLHGLGHGVGLEVHEAPRLSDRSDATLAVGNVVTVEPGVYLAGLGGVRIEDLVVVTAEAPEVLTPFPKERLTLGRA